MLHDVAVQVVEALNSNKRFLEFVEAILSAIFQARRLLAKRL